MILISMHVNKTIITKACPHYLRKYAKYCKGWIEKNEAVL